MSTFTLPSEIESKIDDRERCLQELRRNLVEGEKSGAPRPFDSEAFLAEMRKTHGREQARCAPRLA